MSILGIVFILVLCTLGGIVLLIGLDWLALNANRYSNNPWIDYSTFEKLYELSPDKWKLTQHCLTYEKPGEMFSETIQYNMSYLVYRKISNLIKQRDISKNQIEADKQYSNVLMDVCKDIEKVRELGKNEIEQAEELRKRAISNLIEEKGQD